MCQPQAQPLRNAYQRRRVSWLSLLILVVSPLVHGQTTARKAVVTATPTVPAADILAVPPNLEVRGVPPLSATAGAIQAPYQNMYGLPLARLNGNTPPNVLLKGLSSVAWVQAVAKPGAQPQYALYITEPNIYELYWPTRGSQIAYTQDQQGDENFQLFVYDLMQRKKTRLSGDMSRNTEPVWSHDNQWLVYSSWPFGFEGVNLRVVKAVPDAAHPDRLLAGSSGNYLQAFTWSPDDKSVIYQESLGFTTSTLWSVNVATGEKTRLSPAQEPPALYESAVYSPDGRGLYLLTNRAADFLQLAYLDLTTKQWSYLTKLIPWDVEEFKLSPDGLSIAYLVNENGLSRLHIWDIAKQQDTAVPGVPDGVLNDVQWTPDSHTLAFNLKSPQSPNDVYTYNFTTGTLTLAAASVTNGFDTSALVTPQPIRWKSFDGLSIPGYIARPPAKFSGKRPVIIDLHGGPVLQARPAFLYGDNYYINELGVAKIYPNVRGSSGYGKKYSSADDGLLRPNAVKDVGALLDWIKSQPDLDASRVLVRGVSYGGYLSLAVAQAYSPRLRAAIVETPPVNFATYLSQNPGWRRNFQRNEYGDEREPQSKAFMERTSLVKNAHQVRSPLLLAASQNDPRVPYQDVAALVQAHNAKVPLWYILAKGEGHFLTQPATSNYLSTAELCFIRQYLLNQ